MLVLVGLPIALVCAIRYRQDAPRLGLESRVHLSVAWPHRQVRTRAGGLLPLARRLEWLRREKKQREKIAHRSAPRRQPGQEVTMPGRQPVDPLIAALADAEVLRTELEGLRLRTREQLRWQSQVERELTILNRRLDTAEDRQRELQVLLLHRDEEILRLHSHLDAALKTSNTAQVLPAPAVITKSETEPTRQQRKRRRPLKAQVGSWISKNLLQPSWRRFQR